MYLKKKLSVATVVLLASSLAPVYIATAQQTEQNSSQPELKTDYKMDNYSLPTVKKYFRDHVEAFSPAFNISISLYSDSTSSLPTEVLYEYKDEVVKDLGQHLFNANVYSYPAIGSYSYHMLMPQFQQGGSAIRISSSGWSSVNIKFDLKYRHTFEEEQLLTDKVNTIAKSLVAENASDVDKVIAVHHYISENFKNPSSTSTNNPNSPYAMFIKGEGEAIASSLLAHRLLEALGLEVYTIRGGRDADATAWNLVKVDGEWYNSIVYLDRIETHTPWQQTSYAHLLLSDEELTKIFEPKNNRGIRDEQFDVLPKAESTKYDFLLKDSHLDYDVNNYTENSMSDDKYLYLNRPNYSVAIYDKKTLAPVKIEDLNYFAHSIQTKNRVYFFNEGFSTFDTASNKVVVLQRGSFTNYRYENNIVSFDSLDGKNTYQFDLANSEKMNALIAEQTMSDDQKLDKILANLKTIQPYTDSYREDAKNLFTAMHELPSHIQLTAAQRKEIETHYYRASMDFKSLLELYQTGKHELWKNSIDEPIRLKGNTNSFKLRLSHNVYKHEDTIPVMVYNEYSEKLEITGSFTGNTIQITASEDFVKGRPYYVIIRDNLLSDNYAKYGSLGRDVIISFIVE